jgi:chromosome partitioning protein
MIIGFANQKGGVGKSTLAIAFSNFLSDNEHDVLAIDFDSQSTLYGQWNDEVNLMENDPPYEVLEKSLTESSDVVFSLK